jgi:hypothetical protein
MATAILAKQLGSTYHQTDSTLTPILAYRIPRTIWIAIRSRAPSWSNGPAASQISSANIEAQRQAFIAKNGSDGLELITN